jgi:hypothetical protein
VRAIQIILSYGCGQPTAYEGDATREEPKLQFTTVKRVIGHTDESVSW